MSSVRSFLNYLFNLFSRIYTIILQKIPVFSYRRDVNKFLTPKKENEDKSLQKSMSENSFNSTISTLTNKKTPIQKYKNVRSKVNDIF